MSFLSSNTNRTIIGLFITVIIPYLIFTPIDHIFAPSEVIQVSLFVVVFSHIISSFSINTLFKFPGIQSGLLIGSTTLFWYVLFSAIPVFLYIPYSSLFIIQGFFFSCLYRYSVFFLRRKYSKQVMAFIPLGRAVDIDRIKNVEWIRLESPELLTDNIKAIVADLHSKELGDDWQKILTDETLKGTPVYNVRQIEESLTGRVRIRHLYENDLGSLQPSTSYTILKSVLDKIIILLALPITLLIGFITAVAIKIDDGGSIFYTQDRVGHRGVVFKIYKFRSMKEKVTTQTTVEGDKRITRIGNFIRKTRIDELPQFINVLKGEMSLIGPRAEYKAFADELEKEVPFFQYRYIVKPGISGWAQVEQGYATGAEETQIKVEYDFYYIKHFSFSLDVLIFIKTLRTIFTGFGAR